MEFVIGPTFIEGRPPGGKGAGGERERSKNEAQ